MALLWQKTIDSTNYQVRSAGNTLRLYTDGVFHSQWNQRNPVSGDIWDLLFLPIFFHPKLENINNILVLGVGGGAVINQLHYFLPQINVTGVDLDETHLKVARRWFKIPKRTCLHHAEAKTWLSDYVTNSSNIKFDVIIEDLFCPGEDGPERAISADKSWFKLLNKALATNALLVTNNASANELRSCEANSHACSNHIFKSIFELSNPKYDNAIGVYTRFKTERRVFKQQLSRFKELDQSRKSCRLNYICKQIK